MEGLSVYCGFIKTATQVRHELGLSDNDGIGYSRAGVGTSAGTLQL